MRHLPPCIVVLILLLPVALVVAGRVAPAHAPPAPTGAEIITVTVRPKGRMTVRVVPDRVVCAPNDPLTGVVLYENTGPRPIEIFDDAFSPPVVHGAPTYSWRSSVTACGVSPPPALITIAPGAAHPVAFAINAERLGSGPGIVVATGARCTISHRGIRRHPDLFTRVVPASIEVRDYGRFAGRPRVVAFDVAGGRLCAVREDGSVAVHDLADGRRVWSAGDRDPTDPREREHDRHRLTSDGQFLAGVRAAGMVHEGCLVVYDLERGDRTPTRIRLPSDGWRFAMGAITDGLIEDVANGTATRVEVASEAAVRLGRNPRHFPPRFGHAARMTRSGHLLVEAFPGAAPRLDIDLSHHRVRPSVVLGSTGVFWSPHAGDAVARYASYDGGPARPIAAGHGRVLLQSGDGRYVALGRPERRLPVTTIAVWDLERSAIVCTTGGGPRRRVPKFDAAAAVMVAAEECRSSSASWFGEDFEVYDLVGGAAPRTITLGGEGGGAVARRGEATP